MPVHPILHTQPLQVALGENLVRSQQFRGCVRVCACISGRRRSKRRKERARQRLRRFRRRRTMTSLRFINTSLMSILDGQMITDFISCPYGMIEHLVGELTQSYCSRRCE
ncbi:hypothetical protein KCU73_g60, partial [Aureobasidium melanogenum]